MNLSHIPGQGSYPEGCAGLCQSRGYPPGSATSSQCIHTMPLSPRVPLYLVPTPGEMRQGLGRRRSQTKAGRRSGQDAKQKPRL